MHPYNKIALPDYLLLPDGQRTAEGLINFVYPGLRTVNKESLEDLIQLFSRQAILAPHNVTVDRINAKLLEEFNGDYIEYRSADEVVEAGETGGGMAPELISPQYLHSINPSNFPAHHLRLKEGIPVVLRNLDPDAGLCNGTRLIVSHARSRVIQGIILTGDRAGTTVFIPRVRLETNATGSRQFGFTMRRLQFPLRVALAMTINKAQGQSLDRVGVDLSLHPVFTHGQLYVALSRAMSVDRIKVLLPSRDPADDDDDLQAVDRAAAAATATPNPNKPSLLCNAPVPRSPGRAIATSPSLGREGSAVPWASSSARCWAPRGSTLLFVPLRSTESAPRRVMTTIQPILALRHVYEPAVQLCRTDSVGKVRLPPPPQPNLEYRQLLQGSDSEAVAFRENARSYNNALSFTSLAAHWDQTQVGTLGPPVFRVFGRLYHRLGALIPAVNQRPAFAQTWLIDPAEATDTRLEPDGADSHMQRSTLTKLESMLRTGNRFVREFASAKARAGWDTAKECTVIDVPMVGPSTKSLARSIRPRCLSVTHYFFLQGKMASTPTFLFAGFHQARPPIARN
ncbi:BQ5605_C011g06596 [Microbotryum silenes-dioicae]|uniref:BQ5605_C011g06596 protein n=1 Tax=Microbotryum silenes-dioicae TaxID=796604 RepID=A0A2X0LPK7_9BASI|nr:BQ5605_C011g06596 [Microbotryum silenes-dioicae]